MKRYRTAVRSLLRKACSRPTPPQDLIPKLDHMLDLIDEVRALIVARQAEIRRVA